MNFQLTSGGETKLPAHHSSIIIAPWVITDGAPHIVVAVLNSPFSRDTSIDKSEFTLDT